MIRSRPLALAVLAACCAAPAAVAKEAPSTAIIVATESVPVGPGPSDGAMRAAPSQEPLELDERAPAGVAAPPAGARPALWGEVRVAGRAVVVALVRGDGNALVAYADANGDRKFDPATEATAVEVKPQPGAEGRGPATIAWAADAWRVGEGTLALSVRETLPGFSAQSIAPPSPEAKGRREPPKPLALGDAKPDSVTKAPALPGEVRWGTAKVGDETVAIAVARAGDGLTVVVDANADGDMTEASEKRTLEGTPQRRGTRAGPKRTATRWTLAPDAGAGLGLVFVQAESDVTASVAGTATRKGTVDVDGVPYALFLVDGDYDGKYASEDDLWWFGKVREPNPRDPKNRLGYASMFEATEAAFGGGKTWRLTSVAADGTAQVAPGAPVDVEAYFHRRGDRVNAKRWFPRFALEAPIFTEQHKVDASRPKSARAPAWHHVTDFDAALALAAKEGKPLLVDFEADWCVWCKRLDYYTYPDREVAEWLSKFTLAKMNLEFDEKATLDRFQTLAGEPWARQGIPLVGVFDAQGKPLKFRSLLPKERGEGDEERETERIPGWSKPERFALHLKNAHAAWEKSRVAPGNGGN